jgi:hypothetical protein
MKGTVILCSVVLVSLLVATSLRAQKAGGAEQAVAALEGQWLQAQKDSNPDLLAPLLADKFVNTSSDGVVTLKTETLGLVKSSKYTIAEYTDVKVVVFGNTAIATGIFKGKGTDASGRPVVINERWTDTWVKLDKEKWQCVASHASPIKM